MAQQQIPNTNNMYKDLVEIKQSLQHKIEMQFVKGDGDISKDRAQCKICKFLVRQPILECPKCKSYGCAVCVQSKLNENLVQKNNRCPFSQDCIQSEEYKKVKDNQQLDKLLNTIKITCPGASLKGQDKCNEVETLTYNNCESHFSKCLFILRPCKLCGVEVPKKFMPQHLSCDCQQSFVTCTDCNSKVIRKELDNHHNSLCSAKVVAICFGCRQSFPKMEIEKHEKQCDEVETTCLKCQIPITKKDAEAHTPSACLIMKNFNLLRLEVLQQISNQQPQKDLKNNIKNSPSTGRVPQVKRTQTISPQKLEIFQGGNQEDKEELKEILNGIEKTSYSQQAICLQMKTLREDLISEVKRMNTFHAKEIENIKQQQQNEQEQLRRNFEVELHFLRDEISQIHNKINNKTNQSTLIGQDYNYQYSQQPKQFQKQPTINLNDSQMNLSNEFTSIYHPNKNINTQPYSTKNQTSYNNPFGVKYQQFSSNIYNTSQFQENQSALSYRYPHQESPINSYRRGSKTLGKSSKKNETDYIPTSPEQNDKVVQKQTPQRGFSQTVRDNHEEGKNLFTNRQDKKQINLDQNENLPAINLMQKTPTNLKRRNSLSKNQGRLDLINQLKYFQNISMDSKAFEELQVS